jgi:Spy/CpxP family protein refolding chaperone
MTRRAYLYFVITFLIGIVVGGAGLYYYGWSTGQWRHPWSERAFIHNWDRQLKLTPTERTQFRSICDDTIKKHAAIDAQREPQLQALRLEWRARIRQILDPQQASLFDAIIRRHDEARRHSR